jgi:hypothetical protein
VEASAAVEIAALADDITTESAEAVIGRADRLYGR